MRLTSSTPVTSEQETPVFFASGENTLVGVVTAPIQQEPAQCVLLLYGGDYLAASNHAWTSIARSVAAHGYYALRYDHHGNGDSTGKLTHAFDPRYPFTDDLVAAVTHLRQRDVSRFLVVGDCLGARAALEAAARVEGIESLFLLSAMVRDREGHTREEVWASKYSLGHYVKRAFQPRTWARMRDRSTRAAFLRSAVAKVRRMTDTIPRSSDGANGTQERVHVSDEFLHPLHSALERGVRVCFLYGLADRERLGEFEAASDQQLRPIFRRYGSQVEVVRIPHTITEFKDLDAQQSILESIERWIVAESARDD
jgi:pimeloyl-ACP methyl ester carboxylesterase